jgi:hypothetical protein
MAIPTSRDSFKEYCLRKLGKPVIEINVDDDQVDDRVDEALKYYWDYHFDGTEKIYYKHQVTQDTITNKTITIPENIIGVINLFPVGDPAVSSDDLFNIRYQIALNDLYTLTSVSMVPYYMAMEHIAFLQQILVGKQPIRYNRHKNILHLDLDSNKINVGEFLLIEAYQVVDPDEYTDVWGDRWLQNYCTQLIKKQWGSNLIKFEGMQLPGGVQFNGQKIYDDANAELEKMEQEMTDSYSLPVMDMVN